MVKIGIIGTGFGAKVHLPGFQKIEGAEVFGIAGSDWKKTSEIAKAGKIKLAFKNWEELVAHPEIDAVSIATPPHFHFKMAMAALKNGKHVLCEKPLAMNPEEARQMSELAEKNGLINMVNFEFKNIPHWLWMKELIKKNKIGKIRHINVNWLTGGRAGSNIPFNWQNDAKLGGGTLFALGSHAIDYLEWFFGPIGKVFGNLTVAKKNISGKQATAEDTCDILLEFKNGFSANVSISNVLSNASGHSIEVYGEKGSLKLQNGNLKDYIYGFQLRIGGADKISDLIVPLPKKFRPLPEYSDGRLAAFEILAKQFVKSIKTGISRSLSFKDGLRAQIIMEAVKKSDQLGKWVELKNPKN